MATEKELIDHLVKVLEAVKGLQQADRKRVLKASSIVVGNKEK